MHIVQNCTISLVYKNLKIKLNVVKMNRKVAAGEENEENEHQFSKQTIL